VSKNPPAKNTVGEKNRMFFANLLMVLLLGCWLYGWPRLAQLVLRPAETVIDTWSFLEISELEDSIDGGLEDHGIFEDRIANKTME
jgi:hypothetical protein